MRKVGNDCYQWGNQKVYCGDNAYEKALAQGQAVYQTGWREAENVSTISIKQLGVGVEFKFPQDWFEPPFTEFVLVSKEELSDDEWKIVFDPLVKKGVSNIEATIPSDTQFQLLQEMDFGYESDDDDDYLPDSLKEAETFGNYTPEDLVMSSAIEGFQPMKYSVISNAESDDYDKTYGKKQGAIRRRLKNKIMGQAIVGTKKGQWSARKSQELKRQYEEACEKKGLNAYKGKKTEKQKDLSKWSKQDWTTKSGKPSSKTGERYLPAKAIKALTDKEYKKTSDKKRKDSKKGKQFSDQPKKIADKVAKYRAESKKPSSVEISRSSNPEKKLMAIFYDDEGKKMKTTHFGQRGASDYTKHGEKERMERYLERHGGGTTTSTKEDWKDPTTAGALSRWILWNKPSLKASFDDYKSRFGLKGSINVSKSAETFEARDTSWCVNHGWIRGTTIGDIIPCTSCNDMICGGCRCGGCGNCENSDCCECKNAENEVKCKSCEKPATNVVQEGSFCYDCLPINLGAENESKFPAFQFVGSVLLVSLLPLFLDNRRDKV